MSIFRMVALGSVYLAYDLESALWKTIGGLCPNVQGDHAEIGLYRYV